MVDLEEISRRLLKRKDVEDVLKGSDWKDFESVVAEVFLKNGFKVRKNFRFKTAGRHEIDLVSARHNLVFCVDCKRWGRGRYKNSALIKAAEEQDLRMLELRKFLKHNQIAKNILQIKNNSDFHPIIVTFFEEDILKKDGVFFIPFWKLNGFLAKPENYL